MLRKTLVMIQAATFTRACQMRRQKKKKRGVVIRIVNDGISDWTVVARDVRSKLCIHVKRGMQISNFAANLVFIHLIIVQSTDYHCKLLSCHGYECLPLPRTPDPIRAAASRRNLCPSRPKYHCCIIPDARLILQITSLLTLCSNRSLLPATAPAHLIIHARNDHSFILQR